MKLLDTVKGHPNVLRLIAVVDDPKDHTKNTAIVTEFVDGGGHPDFRKRMFGFNEKEIRVYMF